MSFIVYEARLPDGSVYIGRTGADLRRRVERHELDARHGSKAPLHEAIREGKQVTWSVLHRVKSFHQSMGLEIMCIRAARAQGEVVLNRTRGGYYDKYDAGVAKPKARRR